ncbi:NAD(P)H-dependent flavin oxidoreductase [Pseudalkalibacillus decolorationis]|uniref:NAD(P)H-dependent flavin oxidoreductase n=1 Tax=Pseudalkalibacillus decolorationis TaxID=163879 RepID=UPI0021473011|nr:nitronate monooxygenase [Pseudalkalibacillus decolorationis]
MEKRVSKVLSDQLELPIIAAPMFLVSSPQMVIESCKSGIIGSFPLLNARTSEILEEWMKEICHELSVAKLNEANHKVGPWAVNLIVHSSNKRYREDLELVKKYQPPIVITSLGDPSLVTDVVHGYGGLVFSDVIDLKYARKAVQKGVDGLILVCSGAGGHSGVINQNAFISSVREFWDGIIVLAGSISNGNDILAAEVLGADLVYMGTRFIAATESLAGADYKEMLVDSTFEDIIYTDVFSGVKANYLIPSIKKAGIDPDQLPDRKSIDFSEMNKSKVKAWKNIWSAGHGVTTIKNVQPIAEIIAELKQSYSESLDSLLKTKGHSTF